MRKIKVLIASMFGAIALVFACVFGTRINAATIEYDYSYDAFKDAIAYQNKGDTTLYTDTAGQALDWYAGRTIKSVDIDAYYFSSFIKLSAGKISQLGNSGSGTVGGIAAKYLPSGFDTTTYTSSNRGYVSGMKAVSNVTSLTVKYNNSKSNTGIYYLMVTGDDTNYTSIKTGDCASLSLNVTISVALNTSTNKYEATLGTTTVELTADNKIGYAVVMATSGSGKNIQTTSWSTEFTVEQEGEDATFYDVNFYDSDQTTLIDTIQVEEGHTATAIDGAGKWGYSFDCWTDEDGTEFDFDNTTIDTDTNVYASYAAWSGVIANANTLDLSLMTKGYEVFGDSTSTDPRALTGTIYSLLKGNTCYSTTSTNVGDFGRSTAAIKTAGGLNNHQNGVSFTVSNPGTLTVWVKNGSSGNRTFGLYKDGDTSTAEDTATASSLAECTLNISAAGTYELGSTDGSVYFYYISFEEEITPEVTVRAFQQEAEGDTTVGNETTFVRFIAIVSGVDDINSSDFTFKIYRTNGDTTQSITRTVGTYKALTVKGVAYSAILPGESSAHTFDGNNNTEFYAVYVVELTNATYSGYNVYAEFTYGGEKYTTSGYTFK